MKKAIFLLFLSNLCLGVSLHAQIINGSFTDGLNGWTQVPNTNAITVNTSNPPTSATADVFITSTDIGDPSYQSSESASPTAIQNALGAALPASNNGTQPAQDGQAIYQEFTLTAPAAVMFEYKSSSADDPFNDGVGYSITNVASITSGDPLPGIFHLLSNSQSSYVQVTSTELAAGTYILGFAAYNTGDEYEPTDIQISEISVPEPATWLLAACGFLAVGTLAARRLGRTCSVSSVA